MTRYGWTDAHTRDCTETQPRNQPTEVVWLPPKKDPKPTSNAGTHVQPYFQITFRSGYIIMKIMLYCDMPYFIISFFGII